MIMVNQCHSSQTHTQQGKERTTHKKGSKIFLLQ